MYKPDPSKLCSAVKWKKTNEPAPTSYEWTESREKTSVMPNATKNTIPKSNSNFLSKCLQKFDLKLTVIGCVMRNKKHIPGVGSYQTLTSYKQLSTMPTSLRVRRH